MIPNDALNIRGRGLYWHDADIALARAASFVEWSELQLAAPTH